MLKIFRIISSINRFIAVLIGLIVALLTVLVFYDILGRYLFGKPTTFGFGLTTWLIFVSAMLSGGYVILTNQHIRVDLFYEKFNFRIKSIVGIVTDICVLMVTICLFWFGGQQYLYYLELGAYSTTGFSAPLWLLWIFMPFGGLLLGLQVIVQFFYDIYGALKGKPHKLALELEQDKTS